MYGLPLQFLKTSTSENLNKLISLEIDLNNASLTHKLEAIFFT